MTDGSWDGGDAGFGGIRVWLKEDWIFLMVDRIYLLNLHLLVFFWFFKENNMDLIVLIPGFFWHTGNKMRSDFSWYTNANSSI